MKKIYKFFENLFSSSKKTNVVKNENERNLIEPSMDKEFYDTYLFDFKNYGSHYTGVGGGTRFDTITINTTSVNWTQTPAEGDTNPEVVPSTPPKKIAVKPIDVLNELERIPTPFSLNGIDEKLSVLRDKEKLITQSYAKREIVYLIERLENRRKYIEFKEFFDAFDNTNDEKIDALLDKYELVMKTSDIFIPDFPDAAIKVMTEYTEKMMEVCGKKPIFYVIAEEKDFKKAYEKRDPILLVQSPFGFYWQILGAWGEEEMLISYLM